MTKMQGKIAYSGIEGSFAAMAVGEIFPDAEKVSCRTFREAYSIVEKGQADAAVLPIENSYAGEVGQVSDLMFSGSLQVVGVFELSISQCLLGISGASVESIKTVISHPQALEQCGEFIARCGYETIPYENTARAAQEVSERADLSVGAIASSETAKLYGLTILEYDINESSQNVTRFAVFTRRDETNEYAEKAAQKAKNTILIFTIRDFAGALARAISIIGKHNYNMRVIRSRPVKEYNWQYYFFTEIEGVLDSEEGWRMLEQLKTACEKIKVVGTYTPDVRIGKKP
ncbi:MAG: bifunctional chorismate mutase/prephenate dehydratase [Clostridiales bacterium]|nr:bifunctional chorismate mutase/prephenate dehydratase [Clostridiales bacterium]